MKNKTQVYLAACLLGWAISIFSACGAKTTANGNNAGPANVATASPAPANTSNPGSPPAGIETVGSMATPTDAYKTAYAYRKNGDIEGLKKVMSKDVLEFMAMMGKEEKKTLDEQLKEIVKTPQGPTDEVRYEKITGDTATLEYLKDKDNWSTMDFVKEDGVWKMTIPKGNPDKKPKQPE